jgi:hypothetical protein
MSGEELDPWPGAEMKCLESRYASPANTTRQADLVKLVAGYSNPLLG